MTNYPRYIHKKKLVPPSLLQNPLFPTGAQKQLPTSKSHIHLFRFSIHLKGNPTLLGF